MRGVYGATWHVGDPPHTVQIPGISDLVIAPQHRNRGLFTQMMDRALADLASKGYEYVMNLSASPVTRLGSLAMGWSIAGYVQPLQWQAQPRRVPAPVQRDLVTPSPAATAEGLHPFHVLDAKGMEHRGHVRLYVTVEQTPRPQAMAELVEKIGSDGRLRHVRDETYFAWRFTNPHAVYRFLFWEDTCLEGYLILQAARHRQNPWIHIVDWEATTAQVRADLLHAAMRLGNFDNLNIWAATLSDETKRLLQQSGFDVLHEAAGIVHNRRSLIVRAVRDELRKTDWVIANRELLDLGNWDVRMAYADNF